jgi:hypothetical protein
LRKEGRRLRNGMAMLRENISGVGGLVTGNCLDPPNGFIWPTRGCLLKTVPHGSATLNLGNRPVRNPPAREVPGPRSESGRTFRIGKWNNEYPDPVWTFRAKVASQMCEVVLRIGGFGDAAVSAVTQQLWSGTPRGPHEIRRAVPPSPAPATERNQQSHEPFSGWLCLRIVSSSSPSVFLRLF